MKRCKSKTRSTKTHIGCVMSVKPYVRTEVTAEKKIVLVEYVIFYIIDK